VTVRALEKEEREEKVIILNRCSAVNLKDIVIHFTDSTKCGGPTE
jgi:hypothetical protein